MINILFIGDIIGRPGRETVRKILPEIKKELKIDLVLANGENLAAGLGMTYDTYHEMIESGIDYFTSGNHIWDKRDFIPYLDDAKVKVLRPLNYPDGVPGRGMTKIKIKNKEAMLINIMGRAFFNERFEDPFRMMDELLKKEKADIIIVDHHAEATSNKMLMGYFLDGRVTAVVGTHTHVATADARILPKGTAYITDVGMVGPINSSIGGDLATFLEAERTQLSFRYKVGKGDVIFSAVHIEIDDKDKVQNFSLVYKLIKSNEEGGEDE